MKYLIRVDKFLRNIESVMVAIGILSATLIIFLNVILRYIFKNSLTWGEEFSRYIMIWLTFVGSSLCVRDNVHVNMDILLNKLPYVARRFLLIFIYGGSALVTGYLAYLGYSIMDQIRLSGQVSSAMEMLPIWIVYLAVPIGSLLMSINYTHLLALNIFNKNPIRTIGGRDQS